MRSPWESRAPVTGGLAPGGHSPCPETFLVVVVGRALLVACSGWRPGSPPALGTTRPQTSMMPRGLVLAGPVATVPEPPSVSSLLLGGRTQRQGHLPQAHDLGLTPSSVSFSPSHVWTSPAWAKRAEDGNTPPAMSLGRLLRRASSKASDLLTLTPGSGGGPPSILDGEIIYSKNNVCVHPPEGLQGLGEHHPGEPGAGQAWAEGPTSLSKVTKPQLRKAFVSLPHLS